MNIKIKNLYKAYNDKSVLNDLNFSIDKFDSLAIIWPSWSGKSTLLKILAWLLSPDSWEIQIDNQKVNYDEKSLYEYRKNIWVVFQAFNLFSHLTNIENIILPLVEVHKYKRSEARKIAIDYFKRFKLEEHIEKFPRQLSWWQQQRVAIIRALAINPKLLLLDEPTSALDPELKLEVLDMIKELPKLNKKLILVTHEIWFAKKSCEYIAFTYDWKILEFGKSNNILTNPKTKELKHFLDKILIWN